MTDKKKESSNLFAKGEEFLGLYRKVESFTREILQENEKLRYRIAALEEEHKSLKDMQITVKEVGAEERIKQLEREKEELLQRYKAVEQENVDFANRYVEIEAENNNLANLYVASYQLHSTLDFNKVLQIVKEIIINLIGADNFAVFLIDTKKGELSAVASEGLDTDSIPCIKLGEGIIGSSLLQDQGVYVSENFNEETIDVSSPLVSIPLKISKEPIGAIAIFRLLEQKKEFTPLDIELFNLLGGHAATAMFGSKLYSESSRKLTTIQGFLELLKPE